MKTLPPLRNTWTGVSHALANCLDCTWRNENHKNALGTAAIHARRTGHCVEAEQLVSVTYNKPGAAREEG